MSHAHYEAERLAGYARIAQELHAALAAVQRASAINATFALGLELPPERPLVDAINACAKALEREKT